MMAVKGCMKVELLKEGREQNKGLDHHRPNAEKTNLPLEKQEYLLPAAACERAYWAKIHKVVLAGSKYGGMISDASQVLWGSHCVVQSSTASLILSFRRKQFNSAEIDVVFILMGGS